MASANDKRTIYISNKELGDDMGTKIVIGYAKFYKLDYVTCCQAYSAKDVAIYGNNIQNVMKFEVDNIVSLDENGGCGIWFEEPELDIETNLYQNPDYITTTIVNYRGKLYFDGTKN